jgi:hypothetical protein
VCQSQSMPLTHSPAVWLQLWDVETGVERATLAGHRAEIVSLNFNTAGECTGLGMWLRAPASWMSVCLSFKRLLSPCPVPPATHLSPR